MDKAAVIKYVHESMAKCSINSEAIFRHAVRNNRLDIIKCLVNLGIHVPIEDNWSILYSIEHDLVEIAHYLLDYCEKNGSISKANYLIRASMFGNLEIVKIIVNMGANFRVNNDWPLCLAACGGYLPVVKYFIGLGANHKADNELPLKWASMNNHFETVKYLIGLGGSKCHISYDQNKYVEFCDKIAEKNRIRAQKKIYFWWIQICYDINLDVGKRMQKLNFAEYERLCNL